MINPQHISDKTIAVLPFVNMSANEENEYFSDGITEEIINALAKINGLKVTSRTSSFYYKNKNISMTQIGNELGVSTLLEGSVRLSANSMRITAQLIDAAQDFHFWSETWDRPLDNIFQVQNEISLLIAERLREHFGHFEIQDHLVSVKTNSVEAYQFYLKGRQIFNKWNPSDVTESIAYYQQALNIDPNQAEALVGMADAYSFLATIANMPYEEGWGKCEELTKKALVINDSLPSVYYQLANLAFFTRCDYGAALEHIQKAVALSQNHVDSQLFLAFLYIIAEDETKARHHLNIALEIDPLSQETRFYSGYVEYMSENMSKSMEILDACLEYNPKNIPVHAIKTLCLLKQARYDEAIHYFDNLSSDLVVEGEKAGSVALGYALKDDKSNAAISENTLREMASKPDGFTADSYQYLLAGAQNKRDEAFNWVEGAMKTGSPLILLRYSDPLVNPIKDDPRYSHYHKQLFPIKQLVHQVENKKKVLIDPSEVEQVKRQLLELLDKEKSYLDPELSLPILANKLGIHANQLSWLLNESIGNNFNTFINSYRIEAFKQLASTEESKKLTIMGMAYECGFNSKTVFNTYFKKETGLTPKQYLSSYNA